LFGSSRNGRTDTIDHTSFKAANPRHAPGAVERRDRQTDGQTLSRFVDPARHIESSPNWITKRKVPELIPILGSQPACDVSHKAGGRLPLLSAGPGVTPTIFTSAPANFAAW